MSLSPSEQGDMVVYIKRHCPYLSRKQLAKELDYSPATISAVIKAFQKEVGKRYNRYAVAGNRFNFFAVVDFLKYRELLEDEKTRKYVPEFNPSEVADICGRGGGWIEK